MTVGNSNTPRPAFSQSGVDLTMLLWMASKTPEERLRILQGNVNAILRAAMPETATDFSAILAAFVRHRVEFIVVGGVCAVLLGALSRGSFPDC